MITLRKWLPMGALCLLAAALVLTASAVAAKGSPHKAAPRVTSALVLNVNQTTGVVAASGYFKVGKQKLASRLYGVVTRSDPWGNVCSGKSQLYQSRSSRLTLKLDSKLPGNYKVVATLRTAKKYHGRYLKRTKVEKFGSDPERAQCAGLPVKPVDVNSICKWGLPPANPDPARTYCGTTYEGAPQFLASLTLVGNTIHIGQFGSASKNCQLTVLTGDGKPRPTYDWLGGTSEIGVYDCADNTEFTPAMHIYFYPTGSTSYCSPPGGYLATTAELDPAWGGTVDVEMDLKLQRFPGTDNGKSLVEAWGFTLNGGVNPCTALGLPMIADSGTTG